MIECPTDRLIDWPTGQLAHWPRHLEGLDKEHSAALRGVAALIAADLPTGDALHAEAYPAGPNWIRAVCEPKCAGAIELLLAKESAGGWGWAAHAKTLACVEDKLGRLAVNIAVPATRRRLLASMDEAEQNAMLAL